MPRPMKDSGVKWLGDIPADWEIVRLKFLLSEPLMYGANELGIPFEENLPRYIRITDITTYGNLKDSDKLSLNVDSNSEYILLDGDLLFARSGASVGKTFLFKKEYGLAAFAGYLIRARTKQNVSPKFLFYYSQSSIYDEWKNQIFIQSTIQNISAERYNNLPVPFPPLDEQHRIATFLDGECARIDSVIENTRASIAEYKKLKHAIITRAVTKGIRPNRALKNSGVEWLGDIPADWETIKLKYISRFMQTKYSNEDGKLNYIGLENIVSWNGKFIETDSVYDLEQSLICEAGDILFGKLRPYLAKVYLNTNKQCCSGEFVVIRIDDSMCRQFFFYQLISHGFIFTVDRSTYGTKMPRANADFIKNICVVVPPLDEQREIAQYLDEKTAAIDSLVANKEQLLIELERLKKSLIFEYVTGKKAVPT